jgi:hypothetical protein
LVQEDVIQRPRASRSTLVFGNLNHIKGARTRKSAKSESKAGEATLDLFTVESVSQQMMLGF